METIEHQGAIGLKVSKKAGQQKQCEEEDLLVKEKTHNIFETDIDKKSKIVIIFQLVFPLALAIIFVTLTYLYIQDKLEIYSLLVAYYVPPAGKESIIPIATSIGIRPLAISLAITANDMLICLFMIWNMTYLKKLPYIGKGLSYSEQKGRELAKKYKTFRNIEFIGLLLFIAFPFKGSGGVMGTFLGLIMGMHPYKILFAMFVGTFFGALAIAYGSGYIWKYVPLSLPEIWLIIIIFIEALIIIRMVYGQFYKPNNNNTEKCK
jgi:uncharacterized membrane protein